MNCLYYSYSKQSTMEKDKEHIDLNENTTYNRDMKDTLQELLPSPIQRHNVNNVSGEYEFSKPSKTSILNCLHIHMEMIKKKEKKKEN